MSSTRADCLVDCFFRLSASVFEQDVASFDEAEQVKGVPFASQLLVGSTYPRCFM